MLRKYLTQSHFEDTPLRLVENVPIRLLKEEVQMVDVVVFDIGGVLVPEGNRMEQLQDFLVAHVGELDREEFKKAYWALRDEYDLGMPDDRFWTPVFRAAGVAANDDVIELAAGKDASLNSAITREPLQLVKDLAAAGVPLGILSNAPRRMAEQVRQSKWASDFSHLLFSSDHGIKKPDPTIYSKLQSHFSDVESPIFHFFDDREINIVGAKEAGWFGYVWTSAEQARSELEVLDVKNINNP